MSENLQNKNTNKKPWMKPLLDYFKTLKEFNDRIENIRERLCSHINFNPIQLFIDLDYEKNGFLTSKNIIYFLEQYKIKYEVENIRCLILIYDKDGDYNLNFDEFLNIIYPVKNNSIREKILTSLNEKSDKNINKNIISNEINIIFIELIKEELYFIKTSLNLIKRIYDSP